MKEKEKQNKQKHKKAKEKRSKTEAKNYGTVNSLTVVFFSIRRVKI